MRFLTGQFPRDPTNTRLPATHCSLNVLSNDQISARGALLTSIVTVDAVDADISIKSYKYKIRHILTWSVVRYLTSSRHKKFNNLIRMKSTCT